MDPFDVEGCDDTFSALIETNSFGVCVIDANFRLRHVSVGAHQMFACVHLLLGRDFAAVLRLFCPEPFVCEAVGRFRNTLTFGESYAARHAGGRRHENAKREANNWRIERIV